MFQALRALAGRLGNLGYNVITTVSWYIKAALFTLAVFMGLAFIMASFGWHVPILMLELFVGALFLLLAVDPVMVISVLTLGFFRKWLTKNGTIASNVEAVVNEVIAPPFRFIMVVVMSEIFIVAVLPLSNFPNSFWFAAGATALIGVYGSWRPDVFKGNVGKKTVYGFAIFTIALAVVALVPNALWHRWDMKSPFSYLQVSGSERAAEEARHLLASQEDEEVKRAVEDVIKNKIKKNIRPTAGELALISEYGQMKGDEKIFVVRPGDEWTNISKEGMLAKVFPLDRESCIKARQGTYLMYSGKCPEGEVKTNPRRDDTADLELTSLSGEVLYVKVAWSKM